MVIITHGAITLRTRRNECVHQLSHILCAAIDERISFFLPPPSLTITKTLHFYIELELRLTDKCVALWIEIFLPSKVWRSLVFSIAIFVRTKNISALSRLVEFSLCYGIVQSGQQTCEVSRLQKTRRLPKSGEETSLVQPIPNIFSWDFKWY